MNHFAIRGILQLTRAGWLAALVGAALLAQASLAGAQQAAGDPDLAEQLTRAHILKGKEAILKEAREGRLETG